MKCLGPTNPHLSCLWFFCAFPLRGSQDLAKYAVLKHVGMGNPDYDTSLIMLPVKKDGRMKNFLIATPAFKGM